MANGNGNGGMNWIWRGFVLAVLVSMTGYIWAQQDKKIDTLREDVVAVETEQARDHDTIADVKEDIATIQADQKAMKEDVGEIKDDIKEIKRLLQRNPGP